MTSLFMADNDGELAWHHVALGAFTDFHRTHPISVEANSMVAEALRDMQQLHIDALLVTRQTVGGIEQQVIGLITSDDIERWRLRSEARKPRGGKLAHARVGNVMTPWNKLTLVNYESLQSLPPAALHKKFQTSAATHLLVVEWRGNGSVLARGLISGAILAKRLNWAQHTTSH